MVELKAVPLVHVVQDLELAGLLLEASKMLSSRVLSTDLFRHDLVCDPVLICLRAGDVEVHIYRDVLSLRCYDVRQSRHGLGHRPLVRASQG